MERNQNMFSLNGRIIFVTGAGGGLGRGICAVLAQAGATVIVNDIDQARAAAERLAEERG